MTHAVASLLNDLAPLKPPSPSSHHHREPALLPPPPITDLFSTGQKKVPHQGDFWHFCYANQPGAGPFALRGYDNRVDHMYHTIGRIQIGHDDLRAIDRSALIRDGNGGSIPLHRGHLCQFHHL